VGKSALLTSSSTRLWKVVDGAPLAPNSLAAWRIGTPGGALSTRVAASVKEKAILHFSGRAL
jgi:hypothetical protein